MTAHRASALVVAVAALLCATGRALADDAPSSGGTAPAPTYADKPITFWIAELKPAATRPIAVKVLQNFGAASIPALADALGDPDVDVRRNVASLLAKPLGKPPGDLGPVVPKLAAALADADTSVVVSVLAALRRAGPAAASAMDGIARLLDHAKSNVRGAAASALGPLGVAATRAVPRLAGLVADKDCQAAALAALAELGPAASDASGALFGLGPRLQAKNRAAFASAVAAVAPTDPRVRGALEPLLADREIKLQRAVLAALGRCAEKGADVADVLAAALQAPEGPIRNAAAAALRNLGAKAMPLRRALLDTLSDTEKSAATDACALLAAMGALDEDAVPDLVHAHRVRGRADVKAALVKLGDRAAGPLVACVVGTGDGADRSSAATRLAQLSPAAVEAHAAPLRALLRDRAAPADVRVAVITAIPWIVVSDLRLAADLADDPDDALRGAAIQAFSASPDLASALARALFGDGSERVAALRVWGFARVQTVRPAVVALLRDEDPLVRRAAAMALLGRDHAGATNGGGPGGMSPFRTAFTGEDGAALCDVVADCLLDADPATRRWAVLAAPKLGRAAAPAIPLLLGYVVRPESGLSLEAGRALGGLGNANGIFDSGDGAVLQEAGPDLAADVLSALRRALAYDDPRVRAAALVGLVTATDRPDELSAPFADVLAKCEDVPSLVAVLGVAPSRPEVLKSPGVVAAIASLADSTDDDDVARRAVSTLVLLAESSEDAWHAFARLWTEKGRRGRKFVPEFAAATGMRGVGILLAVLDDADEDVRIAALRGFSAHSVLPHADVRARLERIAAGDDAAAALARQVLANTAGHPRR